jgi:hypothetical protein
LNSIDGLATPYSEAASSGRRSREAAHAQRARRRVRGTSSGGHGARGRAGHCRVDRAGAGLGSRDLGAGVKRASWRAKKQGSHGSTPVTCFSGVAKAPYVGVSPRTAMTQRTDRERFREKNANDGATWVRNLRSRLAERAKLAAIEVERES